MVINFVLPAVNMSGGIRVIAIYARELSRMGHKVRLVSPSVQKKSGLRRFKDLVRGRQWRDLQQSASHLDYGNFDHTILNHAGPITDADVLDGDVVVATWWETAEWVAALSPKKGAKVYFIQHHEVFPYLPVGRCRATYRLPLHKIVVANWLREIMAIEYADDAVDVVPNAVDREQFFGASRGKQSLPTVGFLYSQVPFKGLDIALEAIGRVRKLVPELKLVSFGSDATGADKLPLCTDFILSPAQNRIRDIYCRCDVWVTASSSEGFNLPAMEAMACRTPVVSTRTGWPAEAIVQGQNGYLVGVGDIAALAEAILAVIELKEVCWQRMSQNAYDTVASSSWEKSAVLFERSLLKAVQKASDISAADT